MVNRHIHLCSPVYVSLVNMYKGVKPLRLIQQLCRSYLHLGSLKHSNLPRQSNSSLTSEFINNHTYELFCTLFIVFKCAYLPWPKSKGINLKTNKFNKLTSIQIHVTPNSHCTPKVFRQKCTYYLTAVSDYKQFVDYKLFLNKINLHISET